MGSLIDAARRRPGSSIAMLLFVAGLLVPVGGRAADCSDNIYVFSRDTVTTPVASYGNPSAATETVGCDVVGSTGQHQDTRYILPAANSVSVRYLRDLGPAYQSLQGTVMGLGAARSITLIRTYLATGLYVYDSQLVPIDPTARGALRVSVSTVDLGAEQDDYRTVV